MKKENQEARRKKSAGRELAELATAFIIAWIIYQLLALIVGTMPIVSVVSDSMYHTSSFDNWWANSGQFYLDRNVTREQFSDFLAPNGLSRGDILFVMRPDNLKPGDIVIYQRTGSSFTIVHRYIGESDGNYVIKGDNNKVADAPVPKQLVMGKVVFAVPLLGYPRFILHLVGI
jgi:hypothetical protein